MLVRSRVCAVSLGVLLVLLGACSGNPSTTCVSNNASGAGNDPCETGGSSQAGAATTGGTFSSGGVNTGTAGEPSGGAGATSGGTSATSGGTSATSGGTSAASGGTSAASGGTNAIVGAVAVDAGAYHTCALLGNGTVRCWGYNGYGELGDGTSTSRTTAVSVANITSAQAITAGGWNSCALLGDSTVTCWGRNDKGQLGDGTTTNRATAVATKNISGVDEISSGTAHSCAIVGAAHNVYCWGYDSGTDPTVPTNNTLEVIPASATLAVGGAHACGVLLDQTVECWGASSNGQLGSFQPARYNIVPNVAKATAVASGALHSCALLEDHTIRCWGNGVMGQLGNGMFRLNGVVSVQGITNAIAVSAGRVHSCALLDDGTVRCWGGNGSGQLGDGSQVNQATPVAVTGLSNVVSISSGDSHNCVVLADHTVRCWGSNTFGQLGDGTNASRSAPKIVVGLPLDGGGTSGTGGTSGAGGTSGTGGSKATGGTSATGGTGGTSGVSCSDCAASLAACATDATCAHCADAEVTGCADNASYQAVVACVCGNAQRCDAVTSCSPPPPPPRLVAPGSANRQGPRPSFKFVMSPGTDGTLVRVCRDRACGAPILSLVGTTDFAVTENLVPGVYFWSAQGRRQLPNGQWREGTTPSPTWEFSVGHGQSSPLMGFGSLPDYDGDGLSDIAVSNSSDADNVMNPYAVTVFRVKNGQITKGEKYYSPTAPSSSSVAYFPYFFRVAGDVNGDGFVDAVALTNTSITIPSIGLYRGSATGLKSPVIQQLGTSSSDSVVGMQWTGDVTGDGYADVAILFYNYQLASTGSPYQLLLLRGSATGLSAPDAPIGLDGRNYDAIQGLGDINGDGYADIAIPNTTTSAYRAYVFLGSPQGFANVPNFTFPGVDKVTPLGDVDGDGRADTLMEQAQSYDRIVYPPNIAYVVRGAQSPSLDPLSTIMYPQYLPYIGNTCGSTIGTCDAPTTFEPAGDVNGDGYDDILAAVNIWDNQTTTRRVYLYLGSPTGPIAIPVREFINPEEPLILYDTDYGVTITGFGDINGDGFEDIGIVSGFIRKDPAITGTFPGLTPKVRIHTGTGVGPTLDPFYVLSSNQNLSYNDAFGMYVCGING